MLWRRRLRSDASRNSRLQQQRKRNKRDGVYAEAKCYATGHVSHEVQRGCERYADDTKNDRDSA